MSLPALSHDVWGELLRGVAFGFVGGLVLILLFLWTYKHASLITLRPGQIFYFLVGVEIGVALIGVLVFVGLQAIASSRDGFIRQNRT